MKESFLDNPELSILLIDNDQPSRNYLVAVLTRKNYAVQAVSSGREGYISALRDRPAIIILDVGLTDMPAVELVKKLRSDKRSSSAIFIALAAVSDSEQMDQMLAAGCSRFFLKTHDSVGKILAFLAAPTRFLEKGALKKTKSGGLLGVFLSAKGGMGTSSMCANVAQIISTSTELDVAVMDMVFPIGSIASIVGYRGGFNIQTALSMLPALNGGVLRRALPRLENWNFRFLGGSPDPETANSLDRSRFKGVIQTFQQAFDLTLIDLGRSLSDINLAILHEADVVVIVTNTDLSTVYMTQVLWQYLRQKGISPEQVFILINRSNGLDGLSRSDTERILGLEIREMTPHLGGTYALANNQHLPILAKLPNDSAAMLIRQISREILETARRNRI